MQTYRVCIVGDFPNKGTARVHIATSAYCQLVLMLTR